MLTELGILFLPLIVVPCNTINDLPISGIAVFTIRIYESYRVQRGYARSIGNAADNGGMMPQGDAAMLEQKESTLYIG